MADSSDNSPHSQGPSPVEASSRPGLSSESKEPREAIGRSGLPGGVRSTVVSVLRALVPWAVGLAALAYVAWWVPIGEVLSQLGRRQVILVPLVVGMGVGLLFLADSYAFHVNMKVFGVGLSMREALRVRGLSYSLAAVNYHLGQGSLVYFVSKAAGEDLLHCTGAVMAAMGVQLLVLLSVALLGVAADVSGALDPLRPYALVGTLAMFLFFVILARPPAFLRSWRLTRPVVAAGPSGVLVAMAARIPHTVVLFALNWAVMALFGIHPPLGAGLARLSAVFFVVALPISVQGLGTGQAAAALLLAPYAAEGRPAVVAYSLSVWALAVLFQLIIGIPFLLAGWRRGSGGLSMPSGR